MVFGDADVRGGAGNASGTFSATSIDSLAIGGSVIGGSYLFSGQVSATSAKSVTIGGDLRGGSDDSAGQVGFGSVGMLAIGGSVIGGAGGFSGQVSVGAGNLVIRGDVRGGTQQFSGRITGASITNLTIDGSLIGGSLTATSSNIYTGIIDTTLLGAVKIGGDIRGGDTDGSGTGFLRESGNISSKHIGSIFIGGSLIAGHKLSGGDTLIRSGSIEATDDIGSITILGSIIGNTSNAALITARGEAFPTATVDLAIKSLTVGGRVELAQILGGVDNQSTANNGNAQIGPVHVSGSWIASTLASGVASSNGIFGDGNDYAYNNGTTSKIASIIIDGQVLGQVGTNNTFGFESRQIGSFKVGGITIPLRANAHNDTAGGLGKVGFGRAVGASLSSTFDDKFAVHVFEV